MSTTIQQYDDVTFTKDCEAIQIPSGNKLIVPSGSTGTVTQTLGGNYTIQVPSIGALVRVQEKDVGALGKIGGQTASASAESPSQSKEDSVEKSGSEEVNEDTVMERLKTVFDPEIPVNVVDLGLIYDVNVSSLGEGKHKVDVKMTLTAPGCGMGPSIAGDAQMKLLAMPTVEEANVQLVWDPPWNPNMISADGRKKLGMD